MKYRIASTRDSTAAGTYDLSLRGKIGFQIWIQQVSKECLRVLKPGGYLLSFGGTRTYHRLTCGIEDAGFEIRDTIMWLYGSGFPKSLNIGKQIDKMNGRDEIQRRELATYLREAIKRKGITLKELRIKLNHKMKGGGLIPHWITESSQPTVPIKKDYIIMKDFLDLDNTWDWFIDRIEAEREVIGKKEHGNPCNWYSNMDTKERGDGIADITIPELPEAKKWEGWGTALKPACEPIVVARKPLSEKNVALNVLKWGTGGINIDECRIGTEERTYKGGNKLMENRPWCEEQKTKPEYKVQGRFPANIILDEQAGKMLDEQSGSLKSGFMKVDTKRNTNGGYHGGFPQDRIGERDTYGDKGGASRFFYCAKASKSERNFGCEKFEPKAKCEIDKMGGEKCSMKTGSGNERNVAYKNNHPCVKPIKLMEYLIKLVSKENSIVLDPFLGSGTTAIACIKLNRNFIGIEKESEYIKIANARIKPFLEQKKL